MTSGTGSRRPPTAASGCCAPRIPSRSPGWPARGRSVDTTRRLLGVPLWSHQGSSRVRAAPVADPALIRSLDVGQAAYIYRGGVTYVQVKRLVGGPGRAVRADQRHSGAGRRARTASQPSCRPHRPAREPAAVTHRAPAGASAQRRCRTSASCWTRRSGRSPAREPPSPAGRLTRSPRWAWTAAPELTDDEVRAAWRRAASATHPDRDDGGDPRGSPMPPLPTRSCGPGSAAAKRWPTSATVPGTSKPGGLAAQSCSCQAGSAGASRPAGAPGTGGRCGECRSSGRGGFPARGACADHRCADVAAPDRPPGSRAAAGIARLRPGENPSRAQGWSAAEAPQRS